MVCTNKVLKNLKLEVNNDPALYKKCLFKNKLKINEKTVFMLLKLKNLVQELK